MSTDKQGNGIESQVRKVQRFVEPRFVVEGAGVRLRRSIALPELDYVDPFLLFDHFGSENPEDYIAGFPMHPHRGIETVTYVLDGKVSHRDSLGNEGTIGPGDVQWMTAGGGIMHEEMPGAQQGRMVMAGFQLWVNLPARLKMMQPRYQEIASSQIPEVKQEDGTRIRVIAGMVDRVQGPVTEIAADPVYLDVTVLHKLLLQHIMEIDPQKIDNLENIKYLREPDMGYHEVEGSDSAYLFILNATRIDQVTSCTEVGEKMPQKSTDFYPKIVTGFAMLPIGKEEIL